MSAASVALLYAVAAGFLAIEWADRKFGPGRRREW